MGVSLSPEVDGR